MQYYLLMIRRPPRSPLFPTRRSSDLVSAKAHPARPSAGNLRVVLESPRPWRMRTAGAALATGLVLGDRKSTRLNCSHVEISYAVFCLKKKRCNVSVGMGVDVGRTM